MLIVKFFKMSKETSSTYCKQPFFQIAMKQFENDSLVAAWPCCMMGDYIWKGLEYRNPLQFDPKDLTPEEIFNHYRLQQLRINLTNNVKDTACRVCWDQEKLGITSFRQIANESDVVPENKLTTLDITTSNICNLRCRMCSPSSSNSLFIDHKYFEKYNLVEDVKKITQFWSPKSNLNITDSVQFRWLFKNTDKINHLKASGGEPFYDKKIIELLKLYIKNGDAKNTILEFHTNATMFTDEIIDIIKQFKLNDHTFSIDGAYQIYEYVRYPWSFEKLCKSIQQYLSIKNRKKINNLNLVVSAYNIMNILEYSNFFKDFITPKVSFHFSEVYGLDRGIAIKHLPVKLLERAKEKIKDFVQFSEGHKKLIEIIDNAIINNKENKQMLKSEILLFDKSRNQNYQDFLDSELVEWLND
jgi:MoaA/NifB/PqqE/SkfB family radical SAM enzyme